MYFPKLPIKECDARAIAYFHRPQAKLREGNVITGVCLCLSVHRGPM